MTDSESMIRVYKTKKPLLAKRHPGRGDTSPSVLSHLIVFSRASFKDEASLPLPKKPEKETRHSYHGKSWVAVTVPLEKGRYGSQTLKVSAKSNAAKLARSIIWLTTCEDHNDEIADEGMISDYYIGKQGPLRYGKRAIAGLCAKFEEPKFITEAEFENFLKKPSLRPYVQDIRSAMGLSKPQTFLDEIMDRVERAKEKEFLGEQLEFAKEVEEIYTDDMAFF